MLLPRLGNSVWKQISTLFKGHLIGSITITYQVQSVFCMEALSCQNLFYVKLNIQLTMSYIRLNISYI